jgi:hypothetical protein
MFGLRYKITDLRKPARQDHIVPIVELPQPLDNLLRIAITQRRKIRFWYAGKERIAEPHDYGVQKGQLRLLAYQVAGQSSSGRLPNWRWIDVSRIKDLEVLDQTFDGNRPAPSGQHHRWDELLLRVSS